MMYAINRMILISKIRDMIIEANTRLSEEVTCQIGNALKTESEPLAKNVLENILENQKIARSLDLPLCQDTGVAVFFVRVGRELYFDYSLTEALNEATARAYREGYLRKSIVKHPLDRINTSDNTPAIIHLIETEGNQLDIMFAPKGGGSENMSRLCMLTPAEGRQGIIDFVLETIKLAGGKACPPLIVGVGIGGNFEMCALIAKEAIFRPLSDEASNPVDRELENELKEKINALDIGPMALGGKTTCLAVKVNSHPCHIASLPVAVNLQCHSARKSHLVIEGEKL